MTIQNDRAAAINEREAYVDAVLADTFPASDTPPWTTGVAAEPRDPTGTSDVSSRHPVKETMQRLEALAKARGLTVFARIDFSGDAERSGLAMRPMQMLLFGNPKAGTPLLIASPRAGLDLPMKALVWEDAAGRVWVSHNAPEYLADRHGLPQELVARVSGALALIELAAQ